MVHVLGVGAGVGEPFPTLVTLVRFLPRVEPHVFNQVVFVFESLAADATFVRSFSCKERKCAKFISGGEKKKGFLSNMWETIVCNYSKSPTLLHKMFPNPENKQHYLSSV